LEDQATINNTAFRQGSQAEEDFDDLVDMQESDSNTQYLQP